MTLWCGHGTIYIVRDGKAILGSREDEMTKAERIFEETRKVISMYVRRGTQFDGLVHMVHDEHELIYPRTAKAISRCIESYDGETTRREGFYARHPEYMTDEIKLDIVQRREVARRLRNTLNNQYVVR